MLIIQAPYPNIEATTILPNPRTGDVETPMFEIDYKQSMNGTPYTYVKDNQNRRLTYELRLSRMKSLELEAFLKAYYSSKIKMVNHKNEVWVVNFMSNPFEFTVPNRNIVTIRLQLEGIKQ